MRIGQVEAGKEEEKNRKEEILREEEKSRIQKKSNETSSLKTRDKKERKKSHGQHSLTEGINGR